MKRSHKVAIIILVQVLFLFSMIGFKYYTVRFGVPVLLKAAPVDPRDVFRGEYVRLKYDISRVKSEDLGFDQKDFADKTVYVVLEKREKYWVAAGVSLDRPALSGSQVCIKGKSTYYDSRNKEYNITYGIETYYVEEGLGPQIQRKESMDTVVRVDRFGNAVIENIVY